MGLFTALRKRLLGPPATADYRPFHDQVFHRHRDLPSFSFATIREMLQDPTIRLGLAMRAAPLSQAEFAFREPDASPQGFRWVPGVKADTPEVGKFVHKQLQRIWKFHLHKILSAQTWGWSAGEVTYRLSKDRLVEFDAILERHARDVFALREQGKVKGVLFKNIKSGLGSVSLRFPQSYWHVYSPEAESAYSLGALHGCLSPWADKQLDGGALDVRRLFAHKSAYGGMDIGYPAGTANIDGKGEVPNRDIARQMVEQAKAGAVITRPSEVDPDTGKDMWPITWATIPSNPTHIYDYPKQLDVEILRGLEIPDDVLTSEGGGAWQGKQVPMQAYFTNADRWLAQVLCVIVEQILESLVLLNWGRPIGFEVTTKPLAEQAFEQMQHDDQGGGGQQPVQQPGGPQESGTSGPDFQRRNPAFSRQRLGLDDDTTAAELLVGQGVVDASHIVAMGRRYLDNGGAASMRMGPALKSESDTEDLRHDIVDACQFSPSYEKLFLRMTNGHDGSGPTRLAVTHAPTGGVSIGGKKFKGGEFIPGDVLEKATTEEKMEIEGKGKERGATAIFKGEKFRTISPRARLNMDQAADLLEERGYTIGKPQFSLTAKRTMFVLEKEGQPPITVDAKSIAKFLTTESADIREFV